MMNNKKQPANPKKITILYARLSCEDEQSSESNSIKNQRRLLEEYAERNKLTPYIHICDDGYSGTRWDRPGWQALIAKVEAGEVGCICIKDGSRLGRDYLRVGLYRELFREKGVRLIAINDNYDSESNDDDFAPFREIMAEWYARDVSKKIKSVLHNKGRAGKPLTNNPPFGYKKDPEDKTRWVIDESAAALVRRIFQMTMDGMGVWKIAQTLYNEKVERPSYYLGKQGIGNRQNTYETMHPYKWQTSTIVEILSRLEYVGSTVNFRTHKDSYKDKHSKIAAPEDWLIFENTHPAIITQEVFDTVQRLRQTVRRHDTIGEANPLSGLLFCSDCGAKLYNKRARRGKRDDYNCSTYKLSCTTFEQKCTPHFIRTAAIRDILLDAINKVSTYAINNQTEFIEKVREASTVRQAETAKAHKRQLAKNERRIAELDRLFRKTYEDNANSKLSDERFAQLSGEYEREQADLKAQNVQFVAEIEAFEKDGQKAGKFIALARRYTNFDTLTNVMLNEFIEKAVIHERTRNEYGDTNQDVDIYFNFIGNFELPEEETPQPTPEELAEQERQGQKRKAQREYHRQRYAAKKQKTA